MARPEPAETRGQLRAWLRMATRSTMLDRVPPHYEPDRPGSGGPTRVYARELLARLLDVESGTRPPDEVVAEIRAFRAWVDARQRDSRRLILAEEEGPAHRLGDQKRPSFLRPPSPPPAASPPRRHADGRPPTLLYHTLWDRWLDG
jgi:hypothetical protein